MMDRRDRHICRRARRAPWRRRAPQACDAIAADIIGRDHRLALPDQHAQPDIIAFRALGFLDASVADFYALRNAAHRHRVGGVRAGAPGGLDKTLRQRAQGGLIEQV